ncbi:C4-dicarboxylate transporter [Bradyrhizobium centrolobii]|uniref:C4-dicarboxylate transporter n=1 Tax=Bradyrhizobium centrolobii TaxID=1505087 RepID=A0A176YAK1_9BRAD|nr:C4-dicarboxylate transporter DctA [Bradyrhizobium centrolobii]OAE98965.1 C4-dicarboxylate transporter [Bradyrhizobium centrolobii]
MRWLAFLRTLYVQVLLGTAAGVLLGCVAPGLAAEMKPFGDIFIRLLKMLVAPVIFTIVTLGIARMADVKALGRVGLRTIVYFELVTTAALAIGLIVGHIVKPGAGMNIDAAALNASAVSGFAKAAGDQSLTAFLFRIVPDTFADAFVKGEILSVVFVAVLCGYALAHAGARTETLTKVVEQSSEMFYGIVGYFMRLAPLGAFGAMAFTVGKYGAASLLPYLKLMLAFYVTCIIFVFGVLGIIARHTGISVGRLIVYLKEEILITLGAGSTEPALPKLLQKLEALGCDRSIVGLVVPTGYAFNIDGVCIYLTMALIFLAQALNIDLSLSEQITILLVGSFTSKGMSGVPGGGFVALAATLGSVGTVPIAAIGLLLGIDRFMGEARAVTSFIGNAVAAVFIAKWEGKLDLVRARAVLFEGTAPDAANDREEQAVPRVAERPLVT